MCKAFALDGDGGNAASGASKAYKHGTQHNYRAVSGADLQYFAPAAANNRSYATKKHRLWSIILLKRTLSYC